jgi:hypothetical protein
MRLPEISDLVHVRQYAYLVENILPGVSSGIRLLERSYAGDDAQSLGILMYQLYLECRRRFGWSHSGWFFNSRSIHCPAAGRAF